MLSTTHQAAELSHINITVVNVQNIGIRVVYNEEAYVHPAHCGVQSCRKAIQLMRAKHFLNAVQRAGEHRRVLCGRLFFSILNI